MAARTGGTGGAMYLTGSATTNYGLQNAHPSHVQVAYSTISGNTAKRGGGVGLRYSYAIIKYSTVSGNSAAEAGGGLHVARADTGSLSVENSTISGNSANYGGGLYTP